MLKRLSETLSNTAQQETQHNRKHSTTGNTKYQTRKGKVMEIRGLGTGLAVFHIEIRIGYKNRAGYEGVKTFPTMYTVGGSAQDAILNAISINAPEKQVTPSETFDYVIIRALPADPDSNYVVTTYDSRRAETGRYFSVSDNN